MCKNDENSEKYKVVKKDIKKAASKAKAKACEGLYQSLGTKYGEGIFVGLLNANAIEDYQKYNFIVEFKSLR